jgi:site-specific DNA recombinase
VAGPSPNYGYRFNEGRDAYLVDEEKMAVVRRIFEMVGARGMTLNSVRRVLEDEGTPSPSGRRLWNKSFLRNLIMDDTYLSRTFEEIAALVSPEVAARLNKEAVYGVWWYGRERHVRSQQRVTGPDGAPRYRKVGKSTTVPEAERVAVAVPDAGIPRDRVLQARKAISREPVGVQRRSPSLAAHRRGNPLLRVRQGDEHEPHPFALRRILSLRGPLPRLARAVPG